MIFFIANLSFSLQLSKRYFIGHFRTLNIILIPCIVGQILAVNQGHQVYRISIHCYCWLVVLRLNVLIKVIRCTEFLYTAIVESTTKHVKNLGVA